MTAMIGDSTPGARMTMTPWPRCVGGEVMQGREAKKKVVPGKLRRAQRGAQRSRRVIEPAEPHHRSEEPAIAVAYAVLSGAMVAQGRLEEAWRWLGRAERALQPEAEPSIGMHRTEYAGLISEILDLLAEPGKTAPAPGKPARTREPLTQSETRVLRYLPTHLCAPEIADELHTSVNTVKTHLRHLYQKLGAHSRREAVERARAFGLLAPSPMRADGHQM
jgi:ATP/maltotriose-dependent transcriptional regulator MalT